MPAPVNACGTCKFYYEGRCLRYPPSLVPRAGVYHVTEPEHRALMVERPMVNESSPACGEYKRGT